MAYFKTEGLVLKVKKTSETQSLYTVFFKEYGILTVSKKKKVREKPLDSGYLISCEIITKQVQDVHIIGNIQVLSFFSPENQTYKTVEGFLAILQTLYRELPHGNPHFEIYTLVSESLKKELFYNYDILLLLHLKVIALLGNLTEHHKNPTTDKTLKFIHKYNYKEISKLGKIPEDTKKDLECML